MKTPSLPGTPDYQQLYNEAMQYKKAYFDLLDRYCDMVTNTSRKLTVRSQHLLPPHSNALSTPSSL